MHAQAEKTRQMTTPFDFINSINQTKKNLMEDPQAEKEYNAFMVNRGLSYFPDTILYANEMNTLHHLDAKLQYHYLINIVRPRKRFSKWAKKKEDSDLTMIMQYSGYSIDKAKSALALLSSEQLKVMREQIESVKK